MNQGFKKYKPFEGAPDFERKWPQNKIKKAPVWCSVDLRDGNQALVDPMNMEEKLIYFANLCKMGFKEIEIGFPSASETEFEICRELIEGGHIPDDVYIQVLSQARPHLIKRTFEAINGAKNVIIHFYNSTSSLQREVVFDKDKQGVIDIAVDGARLIKELSEKQKVTQNIRFEYSPESFSGTETDFAIDICEKVLDELGATAQNPTIINLPNTVEMATPNTFADQIEFFINGLSDRSRAIISIHPHNDRGTSVAAAELSLLAGAERVEGTLFGNGERTGNVDIVTLGLNLFTAGIDPVLDFSQLPHLKKMFESCTKMHIGERHPYTGELVFTAFSGSHQDAINKGLNYQKNNNLLFWSVPYLPIDPADVGRQYEPIIRINSQSGKGGAAFVMQHEFGFNLPKAMHPEFGMLVKKRCDEIGRELSSKELYSVFEDNYRNIKQKYKLIKHSFVEQSNDDSGEVFFSGIIELNGSSIPIHGSGNGPIDAFFNGLRELSISNYHFVSYHEHAISSGSDSKAIAYIHMTSPNGKDIFGVGIENNINLASIKGILCAINRAELLEEVTGNERL